MQPTLDPGLGEKFSTRTQRLVNRDGSFNVRRLGPRRILGDRYHYLISLSWPWFLTAVVGWFGLINSLFALGYLALGYRESLLGAPAVGSRGEEFLEAFFFSTQTFNSVGYGIISPRGYAAGLLASAEALVGVLTVALITGLLYARFARPRARIQFSSAAVITPPDPATGLSQLMLRLANERTNTLIDLKARLLLSVMTPDFTRRYYALPLERDEVTFLPLNWTIVHPIKPDSPLHGLTQPDLARQNAEILVLLRGFDDTYAQDVNARCSYRYDELRWHHRFVRPYRTTAAGETLLDMSLISSTEPG